MTLYARNSKWLNSFYFLFGIDNYNTNGKQMSKLRVCFNSFKKNWNHKWFVPFLDRAYPFTFTLLCVKMFDCCEIQNSDSLTFFISKRQLLKKCQYLILFLDLIICMLLYKKFSKFSTQGCFVWKNNLLRFLTKFKTLIFFICL